MKFFIKDFFSKCEKNPEFTADLVTFTEQILTEKLHVFVQWFKFSEVAEIWCVGTRYKQTCVPAFVSFQFFPVFFFLVPVHSTWA